MGMETNGYTLLPFPAYIAGSQGHFMRFLRIFLRRAHWLSIVVHLEYSSLYWLSSFPVSLKSEVKVKSLSWARLFATPWTVAYQAPPSMGFSRQEYCSGVPFPSPGDLPNSGIEPGSPTFQADALTSEPPGKPILTHIYIPTHTCVCMYI